MVDCSAIRDHIKTLPGGQFASQICELCYSWEGGGNTDTALFTNGCNVCGEFAVGPDIFPNRGMARLIRSKLGEEILSHSFLFNDGEWWLSECIYWLLERGVKGKWIIEIGTRFGVSSAFLARFGKVHTFDLTRPFKQQNAIFDLMELEGDHRPVRYSGPKQDTQALLKPLVENARFVYIDGNHSYDSVREDFDLVKDCGAVIFHDYNDKHITNVVRFVDEITKGEKRYSAISVYGETDRRNNDLKSKRVVL